MERKFKCIYKFPTAQYEDDTYNTFIEVGEEIDEDEYNDYAQNIFWKNGGDIDYDSKGIAYYFQEVSMAEELLKDILFSEMLLYFNNGMLNDFDGANAMVLEEKYDTYLKDLKNGR